ncbi:MAG TPA: GspMb/PilO family protein [Pyrinomonadaceae bacterium]|jgi:Tfp pilus assembly protein PilO
MKPQRVAHDEPHTTDAQQTLRTRLITIRSTRRTGALGVPEIIALAAAALLLLVALAAYSFYLVPQRNRLAALGQERERLERSLHDATQVEQTHKDKNAIVADIVQSLDRFETGTLAERDASSTGIIEELNQKTARNALARAQFSFTHQQELTAEQLQQQQQRLLTGGTSETAARGQRRQSVFPGIDISLTVEGSYANVRHFIHDVEASRRFIVIDSVELESVTDASATRTAESNVGRNQLVSLRLDLSAYFRRAAAQLGGPTTSDGTSR